MAIPNYDDETHPKYGIYRFKKGFNGRVVNYAGEFDIHISKVKMKLIDILVLLLKQKNRLSFRISNMLK
jgi:lipid II:glycine glycyltransferase (peptidoglycan interpeptide bridge formation enzyme)